MNKPNIGWIWLGIGGIAFSLGSVNTDHALTFVGLIWLVCGIIIDYMNK